MLFDLRGRGRRRFVQGIYLGLAILMGGGLILFGVGAGTNGGLLDAFSKPGELPRQRVDLFPLRGDRIVQRLDGFVLIGQAHLQRVDAFGKGHVACSLIHRWALRP